MHIGVLDELMCVGKREMQSSIDQIGIGIETESIVDHFRTISDGSIPPSKKTSSNN